ncbi:winged helix-turn-helix domain-containing protein [Streptomyces sp. NBC_00212]|uniref:helix-turn-helix domain-containing protein n=1 Tax=Streptomyces sp. NBC_00212 TaxID=2975684 RepID=UPI003250143C
MIRIRLSRDDLERTTVADTPAFGYELALGGAHLAGRTSVSRLSAWRCEVARTWNPQHSRLFDLYTDIYIPGFFAPVTHPAPEPVDLESPPAVAQLRDLALSRALTPFTRALADGHEGATTILNRMLVSLRATALDPYRRRITSAVATAAAKAQAHGAVAGPGALLNSLHPSVSWDGRHLRLNTIFDGEESLQGRPVILQPSVLTTRITFNPLTDSVTVSYPATGATLARDPELHAPPQALVTLLGTTRAAALITVIRTPALTTGRLAAVLGVSPAAASRHASALREAGLIATIRNGQTVHHHPTRLGHDLAHGSSTEAPGRATQALTSSPQHMAGDDRAPERASRTDHPARGGPVGSD